MLLVNITIGESNEFFAMDKNCDRDYYLDPGNHVLVALLNAITHFLNSDYYLPMDHSELYKYICNYDVIYVNTSVLMMLKLLYSPYA